VLGLWERIRDYFTRHAVRRQRQYWEPLVQTTKAQRDLYENFCLQQQAIINRLKDGEPPVDTRPKGRK